MPRTEKPISKQLTKKKENSSGKVQHEREYVKETFEVEILDILNEKQTN